MAGRREVRCCRSAAPDLAEFSSRDACVYSVHYRDVLLAISPSRPEALAHRSATARSECPDWQLALLAAEDFTIVLATRQ